MNKTLKIVIGVIVIIIVLYGIIFSIDYYRCSNLKEPIFVIPIKTADDGGTGEYRGLGYTVKMEVYISSEHGKTITKVEMYMFNKFIVGAIAGAIY